ncbi:type VI secretion system baseplate subunit TssE [Enterobacter hormaechei]
MSNPAGEGDLLRSGWQARSRQEKVGARDKMQPSLLDRLTDNDPEKKRESANSNLITHAALRRKGGKVPPRKLTEAIINFEPRILPQGLQVRCVSDTSSLDLHNVLSIEIKGRLWCVPYPLEFLFRTDVDLENGHFELKDAG